MADEKTRVSDAVTAKKEAEDDAKEIKKETDPAKTYEKFKTEVDSFESQVTDANLRREYRKALKASLGDDTLTTLEITYLKDEKNAGLKDKEGSFTHKKLSNFSNSDDATEADKILLNDIIQNKFEIYSEADRFDGYNSNKQDAITDKDLTKIQENQKIEQQNSISRDLNKKAGYADVLLDPNRSAMFQEMASSNNWISSYGEEISKEDMREFLEEVVPAYNKADKDYRYPPESIKKLQEIYDNWDSPQMKLMQNSDGELTVDTVAKGCGYESQAKYLEQFSKPKPQEVKTPVAERDPAVAETVGVDYKDSHREFRINKDGKLLNYTETKDGKSTVFLADAEGNVVDTTTGKPVMSKVYFDKNSGRFTFTDAGGEHTEDKVEKKESDKEVRDTKVAEKLTAKFASGTREFRVNAKGEVLSYTETQTGKEPQEFTVNEKNEILDKTDKVIGKNPTLNKESKEFSYVGTDEKPVKDTATELTAAKVDATPKRDTVVAEKLAAKFAGGTREFRVNAKGEVLSFTQTQNGQAPEEFTVNEKNEILDNSKKVIGKNPAFNKDSKEFTYQAIDGTKETPVKDTATELTAAKVAPAKETSPAAFLEAAKQHSGQGYWQVGDEMLKNMAPSADPSDRVAENTILMRALQRQQKQKTLGGEVFVKDKSDLKRLTENIDAFVQGPEGKRYAKYAKALKERIAAVPVE